MYKISVPVMNANVTRCGREKVLKELKRFDTERVFLALDRYEADKEKRRQVMKELRENCAYFKANGFEVGAWVWAFMINGDNDYTCMRTINGTELREIICPLDEDFVEFAAGYIRDIAETGVDIIQFDDDFRYGFLGDSPACLCDSHIAEICSLTGDKITREEIRGHILKGGKNKYRDAYLKANGDAFRTFAAEMRKAVDSINPEIRLGAFYFYV